jgi:hypothetical protein
MIVGEAYVGWKSRMRALETAFVLPFEPFVGQDCPCFSDCHQGHSFQDIIRHFWTAIEKTLPGPFRSENNQFFPRHVKWTASFHMAPLHLLAYALDSPQTPNHDVTIIL